MRNFFAMFKGSLGFSDKDLESTRNRIYRLKEAVLDTLCNDCTQKSKEDTEDFVYGESIYQVYKANFILYNDIYKELIKRFEESQTSVFKKRMVHDIFRKEDFKEYFYRRYPIFKTFEGEI